MIDANADVKPDHANAGNSSPLRRDSGIGWTPVLSVKLRRRSMIASPGVLRIIKLTYETVNLKQLVLARDQRLQRGPKKRQYGIGDGLKLARQIVIIVNA